MPLSPTLAALLAEVENADRDDLRKASVHLVHLLMKVGRGLEVDGFLRHYKWREVAMAELLGHDVYAGASTRVGGDAATKAAKVAEYKTSMLTSAKLRGQVKRNKLRIAGHYNGAYTEDLVAACEHQEHFFGVFDEDTEDCFLIYKADAARVVQQLREHLAKPRKRRDGGDATTNFNTVRFVARTDDAAIVYKSAAFVAMVDESVKASAGKTEPRKSKG
jgi:hypothetical protein